MQYMGIGHRGSIFHLRDIMVQYGMFLTANGVRPIPRLQAFFPVYEIQRTVTWECEEALALNCFHEHVLHSLCYPLIRRYMYNV